MSLSQLCAEPLDLAAAAAGLTRTWSPRVAARVNDVLIKVARIEGDFVWHDHPDTDEAFLVLGGELAIELREDGVERMVRLGPGDLFVVPRGVAHRPRAGAGARIALIEAAGVVNTGAAGGALTAEVDQPL